MRVKRHRISTRNDVLDHANRFVLKQQNVVLRRGGQSIEFIRPIRHGGIIAARSRGWHFAQETEADMYLALLRGINVGGKAKLPMKELIGIFEGCGATGVKTYIQSGNVVFRAASQQAASECVAGVTAAIARVYGYPGRIVLRTAKELRECYTKNPFLKAGAAQPSLHVYFLADQPEAAAVKALDPTRSAPDEFDVRGREIYLFLPDGMARTKLSNAYFDSKLKTVSTARNWNTVGKLVEMMEEQ